MTAHGDGAKLAERSIGLRELVRHGCQRPCSAGGLTDEASAHEADGSPGDQSLGALGEPSVVARARRGPTTARGLRPRGLCCTASALVPTAGPRGLFHDSAAPHGILTSITTTTPPGTSGSSPPPAWPRPSSSGTANALRAGSAHQPAARTSSSPKAAAQNAATAPADARRANESQPIDTPTPPNDRTKLSRAPRVPRSIAQRAARRRGIGLKNTYSPCDRQELLAVGKGQFTVRSYGMHLCRRWQLLQQQHLWAALSGQWFRKGTPFEVTGLRSTLLVLRQ